MWSFRCDLSHVRRVFVLVWPSDQSWCELWHWTLVTQALVWHHVTFVILYMLCELPRITHISSWCDLYHKSRVFVLVCLSSDQSCFVTMWPFGWDLHTNVTVVRSVVLCDFHSPLILMWTFGCVLRHIRLCVTFVRSVMFYLDVTFWIRPSLHKSCFVWM